MSVGDSTGCGLLTTQQLVCFGGGDGFSRTPLHWSPFAVNPSVNTTVDIDSVNGVDRIWCGTLGFRACKTLAFAMTLNHNPNYGVRSFIEYRFIAPGNYPLVVAATNEVRTLGSHGLADC